MSLIHPKTQRTIDWVFLDLDNTLWDFDANAREALKVLFQRHQLEYHTGFQEEQFILLYQDVNAAYWSRYEKGEVSKEVLRVARFHDTFAKMGLSPALYPKDVWQEYLDICPRMTRLIPNAIEVLTMLKREVSIGILTNGFTETQRIKLRESGIGQWIDFVQTSEEIREAKPNRAFFTKAFESCKTHAQNCIYIGDNLKTDVEGGMNAGICTSHFNYSNIPELPTTISNHSLFGGSYKTLMSWLDSLHA